MKHKIRESFCDTCLKIKMDLLKIKLPILSKKEYNPSRTTYA